MGLRHPSAACPLPPPLFVAVAGVGAGRFRGLHGGHPLLLAGGRGRGGCPWASKERLPSLRRGGSHPPSPISAAKRGRPWCSSRLLLRSRAVLWCCRPHGEAVIARVRGESSAWLGQVNDGGASGVTFFLGSVVFEPWSPSSDSGRKPRLRCL